MTLLSSPATVIGAGPLAEMFRTAANELGETDDLTIVAVSMRRLRDLHETGSLNPKKTIVCCNGSWLPIFERNTWSELAAVNTTAFVVKDATGAPRVASGGTMLASASGPRAELLESIAGRLEMQFLNVPIADAILLKLAVNIPGVYSAWKPNDQASEAVEQDLIRDLQKLADSQHVSIIDVPPFPLVRLFDAAQKSEPMGELIAEWRGGRIPESVQRARDNGDEGPLRQLFSEISDWGDICGVELGTFARVAASAPEVRA